MSTLPASMPRLPGYDVFGTFAPTALTGGDTFDLAVADILCYLRLYTELALRAKGILMMRESGFEVPVDAGTEEKFLELRYHESSIGKTGLLAMQPMCPMRRRDLWQLHMLRE